MDFTSLVPVIDGLRGDGFLLLRCLGLAVSEQLYELLRKLFAREIAESRDILCWNLDNLLLLRRIIGLVGVGIAGRLLLFLGCIDLVRLCSIRRLPN